MYGKMQKTAVVLPLGRGGVYRARRGTDSAGGGVRL